MYVYLLSTYDEHGSDGMIGLSSRDMLLEALRSYETIHHDDIPEAEGKLLDVMKEGDAILVERSPINLQSGWGGVQLHVVEIE